MTTRTTSASMVPFQPEAMTPAQRAAVSYLARYTGQTHTLYAFQLRRWFAWCEDNTLDPLVGIRRAHIQLYIRHLAESGLMDSSVNTSMHTRAVLEQATLDAGERPTHPEVELATNAAILAAVPGRRIPHLRVTTRRGGRPGPRDTGRSTRSGLDLSRQFRAPDSGLGHTAGAGGPDPGS